MSFLQVYYTSCRSGLRGSPGFQVHASSTGIAAAVLQQVERICVYVPPVSAPSRPGPDELERFPLSLIYQQLPGDVTVIGQARYVGADYSGRFGNYFAHSLVSTSLAVDLDGILPIQLWRAPLWRTTEVETTELPAAAPPAAGSATALAQIVGFLRQDNRLDHAAAFVTAIEQALQTRRRVVIVDTSDAVASWIAAACFVLPRHLALQLTFNTYVKSPYQTDALVVGTTADSDFGFAPHEIQHTVSLFDFLGSRFTPIDKPSPLGQHAAAAFRAAASEHLNGYNAFVAAIAPDLPLSGAALAFATFCRLGDIVDASIESSEIASFCAPKLARIPSEQLGLLCEKLLTKTTRPAPVALTLLQAAAAAEVDSTRQAAVGSAIAGWIARAALQVVDTQTLSALLTALAPLPGLKAAAEHGPADWPALLRSTKDAARVLLYVWLGDCLCCLPAIAALLSEIGEQRIGPALPEKLVQSTLMALASTPSGPPLLSGVATFLAGRSEPAAFDGLDAVLAHEPIFAELRRWTLSNQAAALYVRLQAARTRTAKQSPSEAFVQCLDGVSRIGETLTGSLLEFIVSTLWPSQQPSLSESLRLLCEVPPEVLAQSALPARLAERFVRATHSSHLESTPSAELLARLDDPRLSEPRRRQSLGPQVHLLELFDAFVRLGGPAWEDHLQSALRCADHADAEQGEGVRRRAAERIGDELTFPRHATLLQRALAASSRFGHSYRVIMESVAQANPKMAPERVAGLLKCWLALSDAPEHHETAEILLRRVLPESIRNWRRPERRTARALLLRDKEAWNRLQELLTAGSKWRRRVLFFCSLLPLMLLLAGVVLWRLSGHKAVAPLYSQLRSVAVLNTLLPKPWPASVADAEDAGRGEPGLDTSVGSPKK